MNTTQLDPAVFEQIVQEVVRRLLKQGVSLTGDSAASEMGTELELSEKLVTLATLRDRLNGIGKVLVGRRAVVTPSVKDELNDRGIKLVRQE